jgi:peroxiredoxin
MPLRFLALSTAFTLLATASGPASGEIAASAREICPILVGEPVPDVILKTAEGEPFPLRAAVERRPSVLFFYRGGWCLYCNNQLSELRPVVSKLTDLGYQVFGISADRPGKLGQTAEDHEIGYTLLSDNDLVGARAFGIAFDVGEDYVMKLREHGIDLNEASGKDHRLLPVPAAFVVGDDGTIRYAYVNPDYTVRVDPDVLLAAAKSAVGEAGD